MAISMASISCKKDKTLGSNPLMRYHVANQTVKAADIDPLMLDADKDGKIDYIFFAIYAADDDGVHLNVGTNPIGNNKAKMTAPDDTKFQNMGAVFEQENGLTIDQRLFGNQLWSNDFAYLTIRTENQQGVKRYTGVWSDGKMHIMALQLSINGQSHFGWARLKFDRTSEILTLVDFAYHLNPDVAVKAGLH